MRLFPVTVKSLKSFVAASKLVRADQVEEEIFLPAKHFLNLAKRKTLPKERRLATCANS